MGKAAAGDRPLLTLPLCKVTVMCCHETAIFLSGCLIHLLERA